MRTGATNPWAPRDHPAPPALPLPGQAAQGRHPWGPLPQGAGPSPVSSSTAVPPYPSPVHGTRDTRPTAELAAGSSGVPGRLMVLPFTVSEVPKPRDNGKL